MLDVCVTKMHLSLSTAVLLLTTAGANAFLGGVQRDPTPRSWDQAYHKAQDLVNQMSLEQKVNITTGIGWEKTLCIGNSGATTNPDFPSLCLQDSPVGVRWADNVTAGVAGITAASSFDKKLIRERGIYMGKEFRGKGIHMQLGPSVDIMRSPYSGRLWEGAGEDPYLSAVYGVETVLGIQSQNVVCHGTFS